MSAFGAATVNRWLHTRVYMADTEYRNVRLTEEAYRRLESHKRAGESFSDTVERIAGERSLLDLSGILTENEAEEMREAIHERDDRSREELDRLVDDLDS